MLVSVATPNHHGVLQDRFKRRATRASSRVQISFISLQNQTHRTNLAQMPQQNWSSNLPSRPAITLPTATVRCQLGQLTAELTWGSPAHTQHSFVYPVVGPGRAGRHFSASVAIAGEAESFQSSAELPCAGH